MPRVTLQRLGPPDQQVEFVSASRQSGFILDQATWTKLERAHSRINTGE